LPSYTVVFDACVLYPAPLRDLLMQLATADLFRAKWTDAIHEEWISALLAREPERDPAKLRRTAEKMNAAVPDCLVSGYEHLVAGIALPDPGDRHVVAAAVHARADAVVTYNLKHFPAAGLSPLHLEAIHPDDFIINQADLSDAAVVLAAQRIRARLKKPPVTAEEYLAKLRLSQLPKTAEWLGQFAAIL
jgi:hypothetical protein